MFVEYDRFTGFISNPKPMSEFPTTDEIRGSRYEQGMGFNLADEKAKLLLAKYTGGESARRYYQDAAIRSAFEKIAQDGNRALLSRATRTGKTFIAVNLSNVFLTLNIFARLFLSVIAMNCAHRVTRLSKTNSALMPLSP